MDANYISYHAVDTPFGNQFVEKAMPGLHSQIETESVPAERHRVLYRECGISESRADPIEALS